MAWPKLVLFDLDDTLCDHDLSMNTRLRQAFTVGCEGLVNPPIEAMIEAAFDVSFAGPEHFADIMANAGVGDAWRVDRAAGEFMADRYLGLELFEEAVEVVNEIRRNTHVGMITNGPTVIQRDKIARLKIADLFPFILISEEFGFWKPDPAIFLRALELGGAEAAETVYIGDSPASDVNGARAAGITPIWMNRRRLKWPEGPPPDYEVKDLYEVLALFKP